MVLSFMLTYFREALTWIVVYYAFIQTNNMLEDNNCLSQQLRNSMAKVKAIEKRITALHKTHITFQNELVNLRTTLAESQRSSQRLQSQGLQLGHDYRR